MELTGVGDEFDVVIIGAGIMGSCTAYEAAKSGQRVLLLEQFDFLHHLGSSHGESRTIRSTYPQPYYIPMVSLAFRLWDSVQAEIGYSVLTRTRHLDIGPASEPALRSVIANHSLENQLLDPLQVSGEFSGLFQLPDGWVGLVMEGGIIKATKAVAMFQTLALKNGAHLKDHMEVVQIKREKDGRIMVSTSNGHEFRSKKCVVTAGAWTQKLIQSATGLQLPIQPLHILILYWKIRPGFEKLLTPESGFPTFASYGKPFMYGTPSMEFPGLIKIAMHGGYPCDPDRRKWEVEEGSEEFSAMVGSVGRWIEMVMPGCVEWEKPVSVQGCMYSMTPDEDFVIDYVGGEFGRDVVVAGGFSGHGFKMGPVVGRILAGMAAEVEVEEEVEMEMKWFRVERFAGGAKGNAKDLEH